MTNATPISAKATFDAFLDDQTPPYDDEVARDAFLLGGTKSLQVARYSFRKTAEDTGLNEWTTDEVEDLFDTMMDITISGQESLRGYL